MDVTDTTRSHPRPPRNSFLDLPREIRDSIYHLALRRSTSLRPVGTISYFCEVHGQLQQKETCTSKKSPPFHPATPLAKSVFKLLNHGLPLQLLRVNKQIHEEATETLYGGNRFKFVIGPTARVRQSYCMYRSNHQDPVCEEKACPVHYHCRRCSYDGRHFTYEDNLLDLPSRYLKLIKRCDIHVQMPAVVSTRDFQSYPYTSLMQTPAVASKRQSQLYTSIQTSLEKFAARFGGLQHSLQGVVIHLNQSQTDAVPPQADTHLQALWVRWVESLRQEGLSFVDGYLTQRIGFTCPPIRRVENVLEPLGTIFGTHTVEVIGASSEMAAKLSRAMTSSCLICVPKQQLYGTRRARIVKRKRRKEMQRYKLGRFYETKFDWEGQILN